MKAKGWMWVLLAVVATVQLVVPAWMIRGREQTLHLGRVYKFLTAPVDPYDAFRGRYVWLSFQESSAPWQGSDPGPFRGYCYALLKNGEDGFAKVTAVTPRPPSTGDYVRVHSWSVDRSDGVEFTFPFSRYYMEESQAPAAERAYQEYSNRRSQTNLNTYAVIRVRDGDAVIEDLIVGGKPIREFIQQQSAGK